MGRFLVELRRTMRSGFEHSAKVPTNYAKRAAGAAVQKYSVAFLQNLGRGAKPSATTHVGSLHQGRALSR